MEYNKLIATKYIDTGVFSAKFAVNYAQTKHIIKILSVEPSS